VEVGVDSERNEVRQSHSSPLATSMSQLAGPS